MTSLPPFLEKLQRIAESCDSKYGHWSDEGTEFIICSPEFEEKVLKTFFKGTLKTFIRQLHFYCFKKSETIGGVWSFSHPKFRRDEPELIHEIKRKTRLSTVSFATKQELDSLRDIVTDMKDKFETRFKSVDDKLAKIVALVEEKLRSPDLSNYRAANRMAPYNPALGMPLPGPGSSTSFQYSRIPVGSRMQNGNDSSGSSSSENTNSQEAPEANGATTSSGNMQSRSGTKNSNPSNLISAAAMNPNPGAKFPPTFPLYGQNNANGFIWAPPSFPTHVGPPLSNGQTMFQIGHAPNANMGPAMFPPRPFGIHNLPQDLTTMPPRKKRKKGSKRKHKRSKKDGRHGEESNESGNVEGGIPLDDYSLSRIPPTARKEFSYA